MPLYNDCKVVAERGFAHTAHTACTYLLSNLLVHSFPGKVFSNFCQRLEHAQMSTNRGLMEIREDHISCT